MRFFYDSFFYVLQYKTCLSVDMFREHTSSHCNGLFFFSKMKLNSCFNYSSEVCEEWLFLLCAWFLYLISHLSLMVTFVVVLLGFYLALNSLHSIHNLKDDLVFECCGATQKWMVPKYVFPVGVKNVEIGKIQILVIRV